MKKIILILLLTALPCYSYEFCSDELPEGCIGYQEGIDHLETYYINGDYRIRIRPLKGYDLYKTSISYGKNVKQMYRDFDKNTNECIKQRNYAFGWKDVDAYYDHVQGRVEPQDISDFLNPVNIIDLSK